MFSSWRASNDIKQFVHKEGQEKSTRGAEIQSKFTSLSREWESRYFSFVREDLTESHHPEKTCLWSQRWRQIRPVTRSRFPVWACAPQGCAGGKGKEPACTGSQPAMWDPVPPTHRTWTSRSHDWCPLGFQTCSEDNGTVQSWSQPHMCRGRLCSKSLMESEKTKQPDLKAVSINWWFMSWRWPMVDLWG